MEEDNENAFVDVCGDVDENNKENRGNIGTIGGTSASSILAIKMEEQPFPSCPNSSFATSFHRSSVEEGTAAESDCGEEESGSEEHHRKAEKEEGGGGGIQRQQRGMTASRKEKSLGKLCGPFLARVGTEAALGRDVHLETIARNMCVEKRRIYDIVNVMEALEVMQKTNKSFYKWHGLGRLPLLMHALQSEAQRGQLPKRIADAEGAMCKFAEFVGQGGGQQLEEPTAPIKMECPQQVDAAADETAFGPMASRDRCGKNSLAQLCRRFLMVLLCNAQRRRVSLDVVSTLLINDPDGKDAWGQFEPPSRSRCRRLYDIANVLVEMRLVQKRNSMFGTKKIPLFEYCGPEPDENPTSAEQAMREFQQRTGLAISASSSSALAIAESARSTPMEENAATAAAATDSERGGGNGEENCRKRRRESGQIAPPPPTSNCAPSAVMPPLNLCQPCKRPKIEAAEEEKPARIVRRVLGDRNGRSNAQQQQSTGPLNDHLPRPLPLLPSAASSFHHPLSAPLPPPPMFAPFPCAATFWPPPSHHHPHHPLTAAAIAQQLFAAAGYAATTVAPSTTAPAGKVRHSVQSILGVSQRENIAAGHEGNGRSPRAFKPVPIQQQSGGMTTASLKAAKALRFGGQPNNNQN